MAQMTVKAATGLRVPKEGAPREYITDADVVDVSRSAYYLRRLADGDLVPASVAVQTDVAQPAPDVAAEATEAVTDASAESAAKLAKPRKPSQESAS